jgi:hypothetical protein
MSWIPRIVCAACLAASAHGAEPPDPVWVVEDCAGAPSHALYDPESESLFISQVSGAGDEKDGDGVISRLNLKGDVLQCTWAEGLNAPKGLARQARTLWVSDIDELCAIEMSSAKVVKRVAIAGARSLAGVAVDADGSVYAADILNSKIYRHHEDKNIASATGPILESAAALLLQDGRLIIGAWGLTTDYTVKVAGRCLVLDLATNDLTPLSSTPVGSLYGLASDGGEGYLAADWSTGRVLHLCRNAEPRELFHLPAGAAGITYVPAKKLLVVPELKENRISAYDLSNVLEIAAR